MRSCAAPWKHFLLARRLRQPAVVAAVVVVVVVVACGRAEQIAPPATFGACHAAECTGRCLWAGRDNVPDMY